MKKLRTVSIPGPNIYNNKPVMVMTLDLEEHIETESSQLPEFVDRLLTLLPGLHKHRCSRGYEGGFVERLQTGTYFGHIIEHVALELFEYTSIPASYGKTLYAGKDGVYNVVIESHQPEVSEFMLETALELVKALLVDQPFPLLEKMQEARSIAAETALGPSTKAIVDAAIKRNIPWQRLNGESLIQFGYGRYRTYIQATQSWNTRSLAVETSCDKARTKFFLERACIPVPSGVIVRSEEEAVKALDEVGTPVVIKPFDGNQGKGVSVRISTPDEARAAYQLAGEYSRKVIVEEMFLGDDYRLVVVGGKLVAASRRLPPQVMGDGRSTVAELVERENTDPRRGEGHEKPMTKIPLDAIALAVLERQGHSLTSVPAAQEIVRLRENANLSTGGMATDVTDEVHPSIARMAVRAAEAVGLDICGIDLLAEDISQPLNKQNGIVEVNTAPGIRMHHYPAAGQPRDVGAAIVSMLYPEGQDGRIPIISITGTNGKTSTTRMIGHVLQNAGLRTGMTTSSGIWIDGDCISTGDTTGPRSARTVLANPSVDVAVLETARGGLGRHGLGYDWSDIAIITNIQADHIGQDGIEDEDDILHIKAVVAERVREGGTLILNAADPRLAALPRARRMQKIKRNIVFFALDGQHPVLEAHLDKGGMGYYVRDNWIYEARGLFEHKPIIEITRLPVTMGGTALFQVENLLAAVAALRAQGQSLASISSGLAGFECEKNNPGRLNLFKVGKGFVLLDYGHNQAAMEAVGQTVAAWGRPSTCVLGLPGDRTDAIIEAGACAAASVFRRIIIKEDQNLRGRKPGETAEIMLRAIRKVDPEKSSCIVFNECEALIEALTSMERGEVIVHFYDDFPAVMKCLESFNAQTMSMLELIDASRPRVPQAPMLATTHA